MNRIDAHQHFWRFDPVRDAWITEEMGVIRKDFLPGNLYPLLQQNTLDGCIAVQASQTTVETEFLLELARANEFIKGIVGWIDLMSDELQKNLEQYQHFKKLKGFRHVLQGEADRKFMLQPQFMKGIELLQKNNYTYDILIKADQLKYLKDFVTPFPEQKFVIDHLAKPNIRDKNLEEWKKEISELAEYENIYCKISGMVTEADWYNWKQNDFTPYLDTIVDAFGTNRIMFGSDWPVCLVAASYKQVVEIASNYFSSFSTPDQDKFFGLNAIKFYNLTT